MCQQFPGWDEKCCKCVVNGSKGNANAEKEREDGTSDVGLWQINSNEWAKWYAKNEFLKQKNEIIKLTFGTLKKRGAQRKRGL
jgi:hypothetical protein